MFGHHNAGILLRLALPDDVYIDTTTDAQSEHGETIPQGHNTPANSVGQERPDQHGNKAQQHAGEIMPYSE